MYWGDGHARLLNRSFLWYVFRNVGDFSTLLPTARRALRGEPLRAASLLTVALLVFLWQPISSGGYYAGVDLLQGSELFRVASPTYVPKNEVLADTVDQMLPFLRWNRAELLAGRWPLWNPFNGWGAPHLANYQSAIFSPFSVPFYLLPFRVALVLAAFLKLFSLGFFTWLFLRRLGLQEAAAAVGAVAFMFGGYNVVWLGWPHVGSVVALPAGLYFLERGTQSLERRDARGFRLSLAGFAAAATTGLLAGHAETCFYSMVLVGAYLAFRAVGSASPARLVAGAAVAGLAAIGLAAIQVVPFAEYLVQSASYAARVRARPLFEQTAQFLPLMAFPDLLGNPVRGHHQLPLFGTNYNEVNSAYVGLLVLFLAGLALLSSACRRLPTARFFGVTAVTWLAYAYDVGGFARLVHLVPVFHVSAVSRSHVIWLFSVACLAALAVDRLASGVLAVKPRIMVGLATLLLLTSSGGAAWLLAWARTGPDATAPPVAAPRVLLTHVSFIVVTFVAGVIATVGLTRLWLGRAGWRPGPWLLIAGLVFLQSGYLLRHYNPVIDRNLFYPVPPGLAGIAARVGGEQTLWVEAAVMPPDSNLWYGLRSPYTYDAMGLARYVRLFELLMRASPEFGVARPKTLHDLRVLGIRYVVGTGDPPIDGLSGLRPVWAAPPLILTEVPDSPGRYSSVPVARFVGSDDEAAEALQRDDFDPLTTVLVHASPIDWPAPSSAVGPAVAGSVQLIAETATRVRLSVANDSPAWLLALQNFDGGWKATVDGRPAALVRANLAFTALPLGKGTSEVELVYDPAGFRWGLRITVVTAMVVLIWLLWQVHRPADGRDGEGAG